MLFEKRVLLQQKMKEASEKLKEIGGDKPSISRFHAKDVKEAKKVLPDEYTGLFFCSMLLLFLQRSYQISRTLSECYAAAFEDTVGGPRKSALSRMVYGDDPEEEEKEEDKTVEFFATAGLDSRKRAARPWDNQEGLSGHIILYFTHHNGLITHSF